MAKSPVCTKKTRRSRSKCPMFYFLKANKYSNKKGWKALRYLRVHFRFRGFFWPNLSTSGKIIKATLSPGG